MKFFKKIWTVSALFFTFLPSITHAAATDTPYVPDQYAKGTVVHILKESPKESEQGTPLIMQQLEVKMTSGEDTGKLKTVEYGTVDGISEKQKAVVGDKIVVLHVQNSDGTVTYYMSDFDRIHWIYALLAFFLLTALIAGGKRGLTSFAGLICTVVILFAYIIPKIVGGASPITIVLIGGTAIIVTSMYLAHGYNKQTTLSVISTFVTLVFAIFLSQIAVFVTHLFGTGTEEAMYIQFNNVVSLDLRGILLAGMIIGTIGVLDDVTTAQTAAAAELHDARPGMTFNELFVRVMRVGREHIASLVNTLVLAYAGASFPLFLLLYATKDVQPLWVVFNSQQLSEEIVRTVVGSITLVIAVPIASAFAAYFYTNLTKKSTASNL